MVGISITGSNHCDRISGHFGPGIAEITQLFAFKVHEAADPNTPRDSGDLANNVVVGPDFVHWLMSYAGYVNGGTVNQASQPFATNAAYQVFPDYVQALSHMEGGL